MLDGDLRTASLELEEEISVPRSVLEQVTEELGLDEPDIELKARFCALMALELGWEAFAPFIKMAAQVSDDRDELEAVVERLRQLAGGDPARIRG